MDKWVTYTGIIETAYLQLLSRIRCCGSTLVAQLLVKLGVFQNLAKHYDRSKFGLRRKTVPFGRSEMLNPACRQKKRGTEESFLLSLSARRSAQRPPDVTPTFGKPSEFNE